MEDGEEPGEEHPDVLRELGCALRNQRLALGQSLSEAAKDLKIKEAYLSAIEDGRGQDLPGKAYLKGFIRSYAGYLGLEYMLGSSLELGTRSSGSKSVPPAIPASSSQSPSGLILILAGLIAVGAYVTWSHLIVQPKSLNPVTSNIPKELADAVKKAVVKNSASVIDANKEMPTSDRPVHNARGDTQGRIKARSDTVENKTAKPPPIESIDLNKPSKKKENVNLNEASKLELHAEKTTPVTLLEAQKTFSPETKPPPPTEEKKSKIYEIGGSEIRNTDVVEKIVTKKKSNSEPQAGPISIRGRFASWLEIKRRNGELLISKMFLPGEIFVLPRERGILLNTGNAGGIEILLDGKLLAPLGLNGSVRRNVLIEPGTLEQIIKKP